MSQQQASSAADGDEPAQQCSTSNACKESCQAAMQQTALGLGEVLATSEQTAAAELGQLKIMDVHQVAERWVLRLQLPGQDDYFAVLLVDGSTGPTDEQCQRALYNKTLRQNDCVLLVMSMLYNILQLTPFKVEAWRPRHFITSDAVGLELLHQTKSCRNHDGCCCGTGSGQTCSQHACLMCITWLHGRL